MSSHNGHHLHGFLHTPQCTLVLCLHVHLLTALSGMLHTYLYMWSGDPTTVATERIRQYVAVFDLQWLPTLVDNLKYGALLSRNSTLLPPKPCRLANPSNQQ